MTASITTSPEMGLLPCPFCGGAVKLETYSADYKRIEYCVMCHECDFSTAEGLTVEETVKRWNTRAASRPATQVVNRETVAREIDDVLRHFHSSSCYPNALTFEVAMARDAILSLLRPS